MEQQILIRKGEAKDLEKVWQLFKAVIDQNVYYCYDHNTTRKDIEKSWVNLNYHLYVAEINNQIVGAYIVKPNQPGHGAHIANAAYMVDTTYRNAGIGRKLGEHSLIAAKAAGFRAMQYNIVISSNENAVYLWKSLGFEIIGTIPEAFLHQDLGYVDAFIMYRKL